MTRYLLKAEYDGNATWKNSRSNYIAVGFYNPQFLISITGDPTPVKGESTTITGYTRNIFNNEFASVDTINIILTAPDETVVKATVSSNNKGYYEYTTPKLTQKGDYIIKAVIPTSTRYKGSESDNFVLSTDDIHTSLKLTSNTTSIYIDNNIILTANLQNISEDSQNKEFSPSLLQNTTINFFKDNETRPFASSKTNVHGNATITYTPTTVGVHSFQAVFEGKSNIISSSSKLTDCKVTVKKHNPSFSFNEKVLYPGWQLTGYYRDETGKAITSQKVTLKITSENNKTYSVITDGAGYIQTPAVNFSKEINVNVTCSDTTGKYLNYTKNFTIPFSKQLSLTNTSLDAVNSNTGIYDNSRKKNPKYYRAWNNLSNLLKEDNSYAVCGTNCNNYKCIGTLSGTWNRPSPVKVSNFKMGIPNNSTIKRISVSCKIKSYCCSKGRNIQIGAPTISLKSGSSKIANMNGKSNIPNVFTIITADFTNLSIPASSFNDKNYWVIIDFPKNTSASTGLLYLDDIKITADYIPLQTFGGG